MHDSRRSLLCGRVNGLTAPLELTKRTMFTKNTNQTDFVIFVALVLFVPRPSASSSEFT